MTAASDGDGFRSYYGKPVLKEPEWTWEVPWYLFVGGLCGTSSVVGAVARSTGRERLAEAAVRTAAVGTVAGPALLIADLGRPARFLNMLRVFRPTSAMSMGSWTLASWSTAAAGAAGLSVLRRLPRLRALAEGASALLGLPMTTYTGVLIADSSIPVWHEARRELPALFAGGGAASAGAALTLLVPPDEAGPARRLAVGGAVVELAAGEVMRKRLGELAEVYEEGDAGAWQKAATACTAAGAALVALGGRRRGWSVRAGSLLLLAGGVAQRWAVYRAGFASARDPKHVVKPQRERVRRREEQPA